MKRVLQELPSLDGGGIAKLLYEYYSQMEHDKIHFDFIIYSYYDEGIYEKPLREMGCNIYKLPPYKSNPKECIKKMEDIIEQGNYDIVHTHMGVMGYVIMRIAKKYNVARRCMHSHIANEVTSKKSKFASFFRMMIARHYVTDKLACGQDAAIDMWGKKAVENNEVFIMKNAVDTNLFKFNEEKRNQLRKKLALEDKLVLVIVGRLSSQKNYPFLFKTYKKAIEKRNDTVLLVIGRGMEETSIKNLAKDMGLENSVRFLGVRNDVADILNACDCFLLPSLYEGLPVVLIETQANGLTAIVSDRVTTELAVTDVVEFLPISEDAVEIWADKICSYKPLTMDLRKSYFKKIEQAGYDIISASKNMEDFYLKEPRS